MYTNKNTRELGFNPIKGQTASKGDLSNTGSQTWYNIPNKIFILYTKSKCCRMDVSDKPKDHNIQVPVYIHVV